MPSTTVLESPICAPEGVVGGDYDASGVFRHPLSYTSYFERYPDHVYSICMSLKCTPQLLGDMVNSLHLHLMTPTKEGQDRLSTYDPSKRGNATTKSAWFDWLNMIIVRQFSNIVKKNAKNGAVGRDVISLADLETVGISYNVLSLENRRFLSSDEEVTAITDLLFLDNFYTYLEEKDAELAAFLQVVRAWDGSSYDAAHYLGLNLSKATRKMDQIRYHGGRYLRKNSIYR